MAVRIPVGSAHLEGGLQLPVGAHGVVLFAHGSGSSRHSPRNQFVAHVIREAGIGTLLFDLLTHDEEVEDARSGHLRFDIALLATRLVAATVWLQAQPECRGLVPGYFGASTGGAAALVAAAELGTVIGAVVSRGGRPDLADSFLPRVKSPTLLIVGGDDIPVIAMNRDAFGQMHCMKELKIIPGATHLFEEPGTLAQAARLAAGWFFRHGLGASN